MKKWNEERKAMDGTHSAHKEGMLAWTRYICSTWSASITTVVQMRCYEMRIRAAARPGC